MGSEGGFSFGPHRPAQVEVAEEEICYRQLETVRAFALEQLDESGEEPEVRGRHFRYFLSLAQEAKRALGGPDEQGWLALMEAEHANLRAALGWVRDSGQVALGLEMSAALWVFWQRRGHLSEGRRWLGLFLGAPGAAEATAEVQAETLSGAAWLADGQDDVSSAEALFEQALTAVRITRPDRPSSRGNGAPGDDGSRTRPLRRSSPPGREGPGAGPRVR